MLPVSVSSQTPSCSVSFSLIKNPQNATTMRMKTSRWESSHNIQDRCAHTRINHLITFVLSARQLLEKEASLVQPNWYRTAELHNSGHRTANQQKSLHL